MKYCEKCGKELIDEAVVCPECGCASGVGNTQDVSINQTGNVIDSGKAKLKINGFLILSLVLVLVVNILLPLTIDFMRIVLEISYYGSEYTTLIFVKQMIQIILSAVAVTVGIMGIKKQNKMSIIGIFCTVSSLETLMYSFYSLLSRLSTTIMTELF